MRLNGATAMGAWLCCLAWLAAAQDDAVCIVGAGFAGLVAAHKLTNEYEFGDVKVFEALGRIGGRALTVDMGGGTVEVGAQWVYGDKSELYKVVKKNKMHLSGKLLKRWKRIINRQVLKEGGDELHFPIVRSWAIEMVFKANKEFEKGKMNDFSDFGAGIRSLHDEWVSGKKIQDGFSEDEPDVDPESLMRLRESMVNGRWGGADWNELSTHVLELWKDEKKFRSLPIWSEGFTALADLLAADTAATIALSSPVANVTYGSDKPTVQLMSGEEHVCDHVIVTVPIGYLKANHESFFSPALDDVYLQAMDAINAGDTEKIFVEFTTEIWDQTDIIGVGLLWDDLTPATNDTLWLIFSQASVHEHAPNVLSFWVSGPNMQLYHAASDAQIEAAIVTTVETFFPDKPTTIVSMRREDWGTKEWFLGTASNPKSNYDEANPMGATTFANTPILDATKPTVVFAGEATSETAFGSVHGAWATGEREALRIAQFHCRHTKKGRRDGGC